MPKERDIYRDWLGITIPDRPLNFYQLLRLNTFEDDPVKIREHYRRMNSHVRKYSSGDYAHESQQLLNELARAMLCLTDKNRKSEYDASLGRRAKASSGRQTLEEILILRKVVDTDQLAKARNYSEAVGLEVRDALVQKNFASADVVMQAYAESIGLPYIDLKETGVDEELVSKVPVVLARQNSCAPVMVDDGQLIMASPNQLSPDVEEELRFRLGMSIQSVICTPIDIHEVINKYYPREAAAAELSGQHPVTKSAQSDQEKEPEGMMDKIKSWFKGLSNKE